MFSVQIYSSLIFSYFLLLLFSSLSSGDSQGYFVIDQTTGIITVNSQMDRDSPVLPATYPLIVSVSGPLSSHSFSMFFSEMKW